MSLDGSLMRGEVIGADFTDRDDGRIIIHVAVHADHSVSHRNVVVVDAELFDSTLPTVDDMRGILGGPSVTPG